MRKRRSRIGHSLLLTLAVLAGCGGSEDHSEIAYSAVRDEVPTRIIVLEDDGTNSRRVTGARRGDNPVLPTWSPNGERLAFVRYRQAGGPGALQVYVVNADGSGERHIGEGTLPRWTNDGRSLVVERPRAAPRASSIHVLSVDGGSERRLVAGSQPAVSHRGSTVAFVRFTYARRAGGECCDVKASSLYTVSLDGTGLRRIAQNTGSNTGNFTQPSWLPDDSAVAVIQRRGDLGGPLSTISLNGTRRQIVPSVGETYDWSPQGDQVAYTRGGKLFVVRADGTQVAEFSRVNAIDIDWSPDGQKIAYTIPEALETAQFVGVYVLLDVDDRERRRIAIADGYAAYLDWRPEPD
jgi:TolB protein